MKKNLKNYFTFLLIMCFFSNCSDEYQIASDLEGDWKVNTYMIGGSDFSFIYERFVMTYEDYDKTSNKGIYNWKFMDEDSIYTSNEGIYTINSENETIDLTPDNDSSTMTMSMVLEKDNIKLELLTGSGNQGMFIEAERL